MHRYRPSPAFRFLVLSCKWPRTDAGNAAFRDLAAEIAWPEVIALARRHRVLAMLHAALAAAQIRLPADLARSLAIDVLRIRQQNLKGVAETVRLQRAFDAAAIPAIFFKGATLSQLLYGRQDIKHSKDIDFLVPPEQIQAVTRILEDDGYRLWLPLPQLSAAQWRQQMVLNKETAMVAPASGLQVEPHWRLTAHPRLFPCLDAHSPSVAVALEGHGDARTFENDDLFAYLCMHGAEHGWVRLKWLADLHAMIAPVPDSEVDRLFRHAERISGSLAPTVALVLCATLYGTNLPPRAAELHRARPAIRWVASLSLRGLLAAGEKLSWRDTVRLQLSLAIAHGFLVSQAWRLLIGVVEPIAFPLPSALHFLYIPGRLPLGIWRRWRKGPSGATPPLPTLEAGEVAGPLR